MGTLVVRGPATRHIKGMDPDDYAVIQAHTLFTVDDEIYGSYLTSCGLVARFSMSLQAFSDIEFINSSQATV